MQEGVAAPKKVLFVLPIYNEEVQLADSVKKLMTVADSLDPAKYSYQIAVGDNASTDSSPAIAKALSEEFPGKVRHIRLEQKGRGRMLKKIWLEEDFDYSMYMDIDLSTDVAHITPSLAALDAGAALAIGVRLGKGSKVVGRNPWRELTSRVYCGLVQMIAGSRIRDFQCGFKGITKQAALHYVSLVEDVTWFFDTELILITEKSGGKIHQEPVFWTDDPGTTVNVYRTAMDDLEGLRRVLKNKPWLRLKPE